MLHMLKSSGKIISLLTFCLFFLPELSLANEPNLVNKTSSYNLFKTTTYYPNDLAAPTAQLNINLSRRQVTLYIGKTKVKSYRIAVGRKGWETPTGIFQVVQKLENPIWIHPLTGKAIPGGHAKNPLGNYWIGFWTNGKNWVGFHGTPNPESVGKAASHGCIRMYNKDIEELYYLVSLGTPVVVEH
jgi:lipoprotein-anchoring transpeptidase ErfK/SrfK